MDMQNVSMKSLLSHIETKFELTFFLEHKVLQNYSSSNKRIITVCGTETASNLLNDPAPPVHSHEEADTFIPLSCLNAVSIFLGSLIIYEWIGNEVT